MLLDVRMRGIDGWETLRRLRNDPSQSDLPVVIFTAQLSASKDAPNPWKDYEHFLTKPFDPDGLLEAVAQAIGTPTDAAVSGTEKSRFGCAGGREEALGRPPVHRLHVFEDVDHVELVFLVAELAVAGVDHAAPPRLLRAVREDLEPLHGHVVAAHRGELDREQPVVEADHARVEKVRDVVDALDAPVRGIDEHGVVGEEPRQIGPLASLGVDLLAQRDVLRDRRFDLFSRERRHQTPATRP